MQIDLLSAAVGGILFWLLGWAAKHFLDRLVLPTAVDWWSRLNKQRAINRAEQLLKQFELERIQSLDSRYLTLVMGKRIAYIVCSVGIFVSLLILIAIRQITKSEAERISAFDLYFLLLVPAYFAFLIALIYYWGRRLTSIFSNATDHRQNVVIRIRRLLAASGLTEDEIKLWLEKVPQVLPT